jgi:hypothetical protein
METCLQAMRFALLRLESHATVRLAQGPEPVVGWTISHKNEDLSYFILHPFVCASLVGDFTAQKYDFTNALSKLLFPAVLAMIRLS